MSKIFRFPSADGPGRTAIPQRQPDETLYDYLKRVSDAREAEIERLNRLVTAQTDALADADLHTRQTVHVILAGETGFALSTMLLPYTWPGGVPVVVAVWLLIAALAPVLLGYLLLKILPVVGWRKPARDERRS